MTTSYPALASALALALPASAASAITIDGDFSDFDDAEVIFQDDGTGTGLFITSIRATSDEDNVFFNYNFSQPVFAGALPTFFGIDVDRAPLITRPSDGQVVPSTGFNFFGAGLGIDAAFQSDFPFQPAGDGTNELFNANGVVIPAAFFGGDGTSTGGLKNPDGTPAFGTFSNLFDFGTIDGVTAEPSTGVEFAFSADATLGDGTAIFTPGEEIGVLVGFQDGLNGAKVATGVFTPVIPEPAALTAVAVGSLVLLRRR